MICLSDKKIIGNIVVISEYFLGKMARQVRDRAFRRGFSSRAASVGLRDFTGSLRNG